MSDHDIQQSAPVFTHHGLLDMIQDPNANRDEVLMHLQQLINDANQLNQQNATLQAEVDAQAQILNSSNDAPLLTLTASLRSIAQGPAAGTTPGRQSIPVPFSDKEKFKGPEGDMTFMVFKAQLQAQINKLPHAFLTDVDRVTYAFQCMSGAPAQYFAMLYNGQLPDTQGIMSNYKLFLETTDRLFGDQHNREDCEHKLARLRQANGSFHDYLIRFRELSSRTEWNEAAILARFKDGLSVEIKNILAAQWTKFTTLDETIAAANLAAQNVKTRELFTRRGQSLHQQHQQGPRRQQTVMVSTTPAGPSPMDLDSMSVRKLPADEYKRRKDNNLCLYCGGTGHRAFNCPLKKHIQASVITEYQGNDEAEI